MAKKAAAPKKPNPQGREVPPTPTYGTVWAEGSGGFTGLLQGLPACLGKAD